MEVGLPAVVDEWDVCGPWTDQDDTLYSSNLRSCSVESDMPSIRFA